MRPSYLARHANGRYYLQMRSRGVVARELSIRLIRASLRTSDSSVARQRLVKILVSVMEVVDSSGLTELCDTVISRLQFFNSEAVFTEESLAERLGYETIVRGILDRLNAEKFDHLVERPKLIEEWMHFVEANAAIPRKLAEAGEASGFEKGRHATIQSVRHRWLDPHADHPAPPVPKPAHGPQEAATPRENESRRVIAEIKNGAAIRARASSFVVEPGVDFDMSNETDLGWEAVEPEPQIDPGVGQDTGTKIAADARFGDDETPIDVVPDMHDAQPCSPRLIPAGRRSEPTEANVTGNISPLSGSTSTNQVAAGDDYERRINDRDSLPLAPGSYEIPISTALDKFLAAEQRKHGDGRAESDVAPMIKFMIALIGDKTLDAVTRGDIKHVNEALPEIPTRKNVPREHVGSLYARYNFAKNQGWNKLERLTTTTIKNRYHSAFRRFFSYLKKGDYWDGEIPLFDAITAQNMMPLPRDKFEDSELKALISQPLFTGCLNAHHIWTPGEILLQNYCYWGFLISIFTGMRTGEIGQLDINQIETDGEFVYFNLQPFDASKGRVAVADAKRLKTSNSARMVPVHPLLINLGLLDRAAELAQAGCTRLFPDCEPYIRKDGVVSWSRSLTRSFQYVKRHLGWKRANLQLYSTRHLMSHWIDAAGIAGRTKRRILGHAPISVGDAYGAKSFLDPAEAKIISEIEPPVVQEMRRILVRAREKAMAGELRVEKPWLDLDFKNGPESHKE